MVLVLKLVGLKYIQKYIVCHFVISNGIFEFFFFYPLVQIMDNSSFFLVVLCEFYAELFY